MSLRQTTIVPFSHLFVIKDFSSHRVSHPYFFNAIQQIIDGTIPESLWLESKNPEMIPSVFNQLNEMLPIIKHSYLDHPGNSFSISLICSPDWTLIVRAIVIETLTRLVGKPIEVVGGLSLNFSFEHYPFLKFFVLQMIISVRNEGEREIFGRCMPHFIEELKQKLPHELARQSGSLTHPIFMPRNEEEWMRARIDLTKQIKYVADLPQVSIHYDKQTDTHLLFTVMLARLLKGKFDPLRKLLKNSSLTIDIDDVRILGYLKHKYPKESAVVRIALDKTPFFRADKSVDMIKARQKIVSELDRCLGEFRDFNGGMILKQAEAFHRLRKELGNLSAQMEFILENYFYSIRPGIMQTVHEPKIFQRHFELLSQGLKSHLRIEPYQFQAKIEEKHFLCFITANSPSFKEEVLSAIGELSFNPRDLTSSECEVDQLPMLGFILRIESLEIAEQFENTIRHALREWSRHFFCPVGE